jgi:hypothetical protein
MNSLILLGLSILMAAHAISTATLMSRSAPLTVALEVVLMFGFSVGAIISGYDHDPINAAMFLLITVGVKALQVIDLMLRGYPIQLNLLTCDFDHSQHKSFMLPHRRSTD